MGTHSVAEIIISISLMLFAGFLAGIGNFITYRWVITDYYANYIEEYLDVFSATMKTNLPEGWRAMMRAMMSNPVMIIFSTLFNIVIYGVFIGLVASVFIKRPEIQKHGE